MSPLASEMMMGLLQLLHLKKLLSRMMRPEAMHTASRCDTMSSSSASMAGLPVKVAVLQAQQLLGPISLPWIDSLTKHQISQVQLRNGFDA
jgi:hypothetical protein